MELYKITKFRGANDMPEKPILTAKRSYGGEGIAWRTDPSQHLAEVLKKLWIDTEGFGVQIQMFSDEEILEEPGPFVYVETEAEFIEKVEGMKQKVKLGVYRALTGYYYYDPEKGKYVGQPISDNDVPFESDDEAGIEKAFKEAVDRIRWLQGMHKIYG